MDRPYQRASTSYRLAAFTIDCLLITLALTLSQNLIDDPVIDLWLGKTVLCLAYFILLERKGTLGKRVFSLVVLTQETLRPTRYTIIIRTILKLLFFMAVFSVTFGYVKHNNVVAALSYILGGAYSALNLYYYILHEGLFVHDLFTNTTIYKADRK